VLFHLVPLPYIVIGNANLTNAFAQAVALAGLCALALMPFPLRSVRAAASALGVCLLTTLAFLSHISTIVLMAGILGVSVVAFAVPARHESRRLAVFVVVMTLVAGGLAVGAYYRHFGDVFQTAFERVLAPSADPAPAPPASSDAGAPAVLSRQLAWSERAAASATQTLADLGWPLLFLAGVGSVAGLRPSGGRVPLLLVAWVVAWALFLLGGTFTRVDTQFQRYAAEFVARVNLAGYPAIVALAALGATSLWRQGSVARLGAFGLVLMTTALGVTSWFRWLS
jgi:hypothetical protein